MHWLLLGLMNHPSFDADGLLSCCKNPHSPPINFGIFEKQPDYIKEATEEVKFSCDRDVLEIINDRLSYKYPYSALSDTPVKYAASAMKTEENLKYLTSESPAFSGAGDLTPAQRGTLAHKFMEMCDLKCASENLSGEIERLVGNKSFTEKEAEAINVNSIKSFFNSDLYKRIASAEKYIREQEFSMSVPVCQVNDTLPENVCDERVIVQGVIDGLIINDNNGEIVDYKTDKVSSVEELCEKYGEQMKMYKKAAEECFGLQNVTITLYSFHLSKEISLKL
jgi:ATP-dependent helicase/nuclease subunit A